jgi:hypothetical protein
MNATQKKPINMKDPTLSPREIAMLMGEIDNKVALARVKDEKTKTYLSVKPILVATKHFNMKDVQMTVDAEGTFYHTEKSLREQGLREIPRESYPSPYGGSLYMMAHYRSLQGN